MTEESAAILFHSLKYSRSITNLKLSNCKFSTEGFKQLSTYLRETRVLSELWIEDLEMLGISVRLLSDLRTTTKWSSAITSPRCSSVSLGTSRYPS